MGCLGNGSTMDVSVPTKIDVQGKKLKAISMGKRHAVSITEDGEVFSWGKGEPIGNFNTYRRMVISLQCFTLNRVIFVEFIA
jgi:alpha-tubulin suppressor-like RCC1 family protein